MPSFKTELLGTLTRTETFYKETIEYYISKKDYALAYEYSIRMHEIQIVQELVKWTNE